jgi:hypothetical protein
MGGGSKSMEGNEGLASTYLVWRTLSPFSLLPLLLPRRQWLTAVIGQPASRCLCGGRWLGATRRPRPLGCVGDIGARMHSCHWTAGQLLSMRRARAWSHALSETKVDGGDRCGWHRLGRCTHQLVCIMTQRGGKGECVSRCRVVGQVVSAWWATGSCLRSFGQRRAVESARLRGTRGRRALTSSGTPSPLFSFLPLLLPLRDGPGLSLDSL